MTLTVQTTGKAAGVWEALSNFQYLNVSYEDPGLYWLTSLTIAAVKIFDPAFQPSEMVMYPVQLAIFAIAILLLTWRVIPLGIALSGTAVFLIALELVKILYWSWDVYWAPALSVLVTIAFLLSVTSLREQPRSWIASACFGVFVGFLGLIRQDAGLIAQAGGFAFAVCLAFYGLPRKPSTPATHLHLRAAAFVLCFLVATMLPRLGLMSHVALVEWLKPPNPPIQLTEHGKWHNIYLGMGFNIAPYPSPSNPYGIAWDDTVAAFHAVEQDPTARFGTPGYMPTLRHLVVKIIADDPVFYVKTVAARVRYEFSLLRDFATSRVGPLAYPLLFLPFLPLAFLFRSGKRAANGLIHLLLGVAALMPPVLTFPSPAYSTGFGMTLLACPLFQLGTLLEMPLHAEYFPVSKTRRALLLVTLLLLLATTAFVSLAVRAGISNERFQQSLVGEPDTLLASVRSDSWRADRHFNHSLSAAQRTAAAAKVLQVRGQISDSTGGSIEHFPDSCLHVINVTRQGHQIVWFVESKVALRYGIFLLKPEGGDQVFYRKVLDWVPSQTYLLVFNTAPPGAQSQSFTLALKQDTAGFTTEPSAPVARVTLASGKP